MKNLLKNSDIKVNDYKYQIALRKPWYINNVKFTRYIRRFIQNLPNWRMQWKGKYLIIDLYFDDEGLDRDDKTARWKTESMNALQGTLVSFKREDDSIITNIWI